MTYEDFTAFMEYVVLPRQTANPDHVRLDGQTSGSSRDVAGKFKYRDVVWSVHADTHYEPLMVAYASAQKGLAPFDEEETERGLKLVLNPALQSLRNTPHQYMYMYSW